MIKKDNLFARFFLYSLFFILVYANPAFAEIHGTQDLSGVYYHVEGNKARSFYPGNEADYLYEGSVDFQDPIFKDYQFFGNINYRSTNDKMVDRQELSLERMYFGIKGLGKELLLGDYYASFSEYSLGNALKGGKLVYGEDKASRLTVVGGVDTSKWEDLWERHWDDSATRRYVWGTRLENNLFNNKLALNFNYAGAKDDIAFISPSSSPILVNVFSLDGKYNINQYFTAKSELAQSLTDENTRSHEIKSKSDRAFKFGLDFNSLNYTLASIYSRVGKHFNTTGGFSAQDLETMNFDGLWFLPWRAKLIHYLHMDKDNLSKNKTTTTKQLNPGLKLNLKLPHEIGLDLGGDLRKRLSADKNTNERTYTYTSNFTRDFGIFYSTLGYSKIFVINRVSASQERNSDRYSFGLDGNFNMKKVKFAWNFSEDLESINYKQACKSDFTTSTNLGLRAAFPSTLSFQAKLGFSDNDYYLNDTDSSNMQYFFSVSRDIFKDSLSFDVSFERKSYRYADGGNNYAENILRGKINYKF